MEKISSYISTIWKEITKKNCVCGVYFVFLQPERTFEDIEKIQYG